MWGKIVDRSPVWNCSWVLTPASFNPAHAAKEIHVVHTQCRGDAVTMSHSKLSAVECAQRNQRKLQPREFGVVMKSMSLFYVRLINFKNRIGG